MSAADDVLAVARRELGTVERPAGSNRQRYGEAYGANGVAWCAQFVWYSFVQSGHGALIPKTAYTPTFADWFRKRKQWGTAPRPGAVVFFDFPGDGVNRISHVGIVEAVNRDGTVTVIEGNTSSGARGSQRDGGGVHRRNRRAGIVGYGYPAYGGSTPAAAAADPVRATQTAVHVSADGIWGRGTDRAVGLVRTAATGGPLVHPRDTQRAVGAAVDGAWGPASRRALTETVTELQRAWAATPDGLWGPRTDQAWAVARARHGRGL